MLKLLVLGKISLQAQRKTCLAAALVGCAAARFAATGGSLPLNKKAIAVERAVVVVDVSLHYCSLS